MAALGSSAPLSHTNARLASARRLTSRKDRRDAGRFLAEGVQAVRSALETGAVIELFATADAIARHPDLTSGASEITAKDAAALSETNTPQGIVAVCTISHHDLADAVAARPRMLVALLEPNDPGNLGTVIRTADAAGADALLIVGGGADPYNGKVVRASAGSLFHLPIIECSVDDMFGAAAAAQLLTVATAGSAPSTLDELADDGTLRAATMWLFGTEAHGLPADVAAAADRTVRIPIYGRAESLNLAAAVAVCLYAGARAQRAPR